jgi:hypothetical protein
MYSNNNDIGLMKTIHIQIDQMSIIDTYMSKGENMSRTMPKQHKGFATSMDPDQPAHPHSLIRIHAVRLQTL